MRKTKAKLRVLGSITSIFNRLNDKLSILENPSANRNKRKVSYEEVKTSIDKDKEERKQETKNIQAYFNEINDKIDSHDRTISEHSTEISNLKQGVVELKDAVAVAKDEIKSPEEEINLKPEAEKIDGDTLTRDIIDAKPADTKPDINDVEITQEKLDRLGIEFHEKTQRYRGTGEKFFGKKFVSEKNIKEKILQLENEDAIKSDEGLFENTLFEKLQEIFTTVDNIFQFLIKKFSDIGPKPEADLVPTSGGTTKPKDEKEKGGFLSAISGLVAFTLFAVFPMILKFIREKREQISEFLEPAFKFVIEDIPKFLFETIPDFFMETLPKYFKEKYESVKGVLGDLVDNAKIFASGLKKSVGEMIVKVGESMPDWLGGLKSGITEYGKEMIANADKSISEAEQRKKDRQNKRIEKQNQEKLEQMAAAEVERRKKDNPNIDDYELTWDKSKNMVMVQLFYKGTDKSMGGDEYIAFDSEASLKTNSLVPYKPGSKPKDSDKKDANAVPGVSQNTPGRPTPAGAGGISTSQGMGSQGSTPSATPEEKTETTAPSAASPVSSASSSMPGLTGVSSSSGQQLIQETQKATDPEIDAAAAKSTVQTVKTGSGKSKPSDYTLIAGRPHSISYVPDPTPVLGNLAPQLFFLTH